MSSDNEAVIAFLKTRQGVAPDAALLARLAPVTEALNRTVREAAAALPFEAEPADFHRCADAVADARTGARDD